MLSAISYLLSTLIVQTYDDLHQRPILCAKSQPSPACFLHSLQAYGGCFHTATMGVKEYNYCVILSAIFKGLESFLKLCNSSTLCSSESCFSLFVNREPLEHQVIPDLTGEMARRFATYFYTFLFLQNKMFDQFPGLVLSITCRLYDNWKFFNLLQAKCPFLVSEKSGSYPT